MMMRSRSYSSAVSLGLLSAFGLIAVLFVAIGSERVTADTQSKGEPASEGRPITPAGSLVIDADTKLPAVGALPVAFVRSPDSIGPAQSGRYLLAVNSGFGLQFNAANRDAKQSIAVIDLARPSPMVIQNVYFPAPQSANVGMVFAPRADEDGSFALYVSGGFENKIWIFRFQPNASAPISPVNAAPEARVEAPFIDVSGLAASPPSPRYNKNVASVYPTGLAISPDGDTLYVADNLDDSLGIISGLHGVRKIARVDLRRGDPHRFIYPYGVSALPSGDGSMRTAKVYVSCWNDGSLAVVDPNESKRVITHIPVERHPTAMILNSSRTRLYVVNSNADSVSVVDTTVDREIERINIRLAEQKLSGSSPEGLALSADGNTLYVASAISNAVAVVALSPGARGTSKGNAAAREIENDAPGKERSKVKGLIPTGQYPSAVAIVGSTIFVGNGKGSGMANSSVVVDNSGRVPNAPNERFPAGAARGRRQGGEYSVALVAGTISSISIPSEPELARYTQQVMRNNGLMGQRTTRLFTGPTPFKHIIYIIKENRTYDQIFGDVERSGDGRVADGDPKLAIFGSNETARSPRGSRQDITPNHRALALRFGLMDRFFVNAEASPDGHNWSTAAFSSDYVDKAFRWNYSGRGRTYDFEGFNRLPNYEPSTGMSPVFHVPVTGGDVSDYLRNYVPYLFGGRDASEPETLYLWDAAQRRGLSYRNYGEYVATISESDVAAINAGKAKSYPDTSSTLRTIPTKKSLEGHHNETFRAFDLFTPDSMTTDSYRAIKTNGGGRDPLITGNNSDKRFQGNSRFGEWMKEFHGYAAEREAGKPDRLPNLSIVRLSSDHTSGMRPGLPTPQFYVADNDYGLGHLVEAVSESQYWKDTAIFVVEDDAQDGPDHVDAHRSPALVISAYNRPGALIHDFHNTVSLIRTMEILLGLPPMNQLDDAASPIDIFRDQADFRPYHALLPEVALDNLITPPSDRSSSTAAYWIRRTAEQDFSHPDIADPHVLNEIIWYSVRGKYAPIPAVARLPAFDLMSAGLRDLEEREESARVERGRGD